MSEELVYYPNLAEERRPNPHARLSTARFKYWWSRHLMPFRDFEARGAFVGCSVVPVRLDVACNRIKELGCHAVSKWLNLEMTVAVPC